LNSIVGGKVSNRGPGRRLAIKSARPAAAAQQRNLASAAMPNQIRNAGIEFKFNKL
jgi:hypothetical protein